jgi:hypothetical protein
MAAWKDEWLQLAALDPKQPIDHYLLDEWAENSDLPNLSVYNIIQSSDHPQIIPLGRFQFSSGRFLGKLLAGNRKPRGCW